MERLKGIIKIIRDWIHGTAYYEDSMILGIITLVLVYATEILLPLLIITLIKK